ncbi:hypothetical protein SHIRM173S_07086 [Streptomyces hirsutus]
MISSGGRRSAASPSSGRVPWSKEKMKYDFGLTSPFSLSLRADGSKAIPPRRQVLLETAGARAARDRAISLATVATLERRAAPASACIPRSGSTASDGGRPAAVWWPSTRRAAP